MADLKLNRLRRDVGTTEQPRVKARELRGEDSTVRRTGFEQSDIPASLIHGGEVRGLGEGKSLLGGGALESLRLRQAKSPRAENKRPTKPTTGSVAVLDAAFGPGVSTSRAQRLLKTRGIKLERSDGQVVLTADPRATDELRDLALRGDLAAKLNTWGVDGVRVTENDGSITRLVALKKNAAGDPVFSVAQAQQVLERLASNPKVPFNVVEDGCVDRVEVMISDLMAMGVSPSAFGLVASRTPDLRVKTLDHVADRLKQDGDKSDLDVFSMPDTLSANAKAALQDLKPPVGQARSFEIDGQHLTLFADGSVQAEGLAMNPKDRVWWSVGHIAIEPRMEDGAARRLFDPSAAQETLSIADWKAAQNCDNGEIYAGSLDAKPLHMPEHSSDARLDQAIQILQDHGVTGQGSLDSREVKVAFVRDAVAGLDDPTRASFYNHYHRIEHEREPFRYENWDGYSIAGRPTDGDGAPLPKWEDMQPGSEAFATRRDRATEPREDDGLGLAPLRAFATLLESAAEGHPPPSTLKDVSPTATAIGGMYRSSNPIEP